MNATPQAATMVSSDDVNGTAVYGRDGTQIGHIDHLMIDKQSGNVAYAVMGFGGFMGLGEDHYPVPWNTLRYDTVRQGFVTDITEEQLKDAPPHGENWHTDREWERRTFDYYGVPYYWF
jgi:sporulation protein YlmC with PRC-barrel domain